MLQDRCQNTQYFIFITQKSVDIQHMHAENSRNYKFDFFWDNK